MVNDGTDEGEQVEATAQVLNMNPQASVEVRSTNVWIGETTVLSGAQSTDLDGRVVMHRWTVDDTVLVGEDVVLIVEATTEVSLTVIDEHGGTSTAAITLTPTTGPSVQSLVALHDGEGAVELTWTWDGEPAVHHIYRNGAMIGTTNATGFTDRPQ